MISLTPTSGTYMLHLSLKSPLLFAFFTKRDPSKFILRGVPYRFIFYNFAAISYIKDILAPARKCGGHRFGYCPDCRNDVTRLRLSANDRCFVAAFRGSLQVRPVAPKRKHPTGCFLFGVVSGVWSSQTEDQTMIRFPFGIRISGFSLFFMFSS